MKQVRKLLNDLVNIFAQLFHMSLYSSVSCFEFSHEFVNLAMKRFIGELASLIVTLFIRLIRE
jgi:hypothetical protein